MINLLPPDVKQSIAYARRNTSLRTWGYVTVFCSVLICLVVAAGYFYLQHSIQTYDKRVNESKQYLSDQKLEETQRDIETVSSNLKLVVQVLSRAVLFSRLLEQVGTATPNGAVLTNLSISNKVQGGIDLTFSATDYQTATQVQVNLSDTNNQIFEKADIVSIQCNNATGGAVSQYPCTVQIRALFAKNNTFGFLSNTKAATP
jgi:Tfp pilus assembly protein PilN